MFNAQAKLDRSRKTHLQLLTEAAEGECVDDCEGNWLRLAEELLTANGIQLTEFATAVLLCELELKMQSAYFQMIFVGMKK